MILREEDVAVSNIKIDLTRGRNNPLERYSRNDDNEPPIHSSDFNFRTVIYKNCIFLFMHASLPVSIFSRYASRTFSGLICLYALCLIRTWLRLNIISFLIFRIASSDGCATVTSCCYTTAAISWLLKIEVTSDLLFVELIKINTKGRTFVL